MSEKLIKTINTIFITAILLMVFIALLVVVMNLSKNITKNAEKTTILEVTNLNATDTIDVYLTLNNESGYINDVNGIFGIKSTNKLQGKFQLKPHETVKYIPPYGEPIGGNISFLKAPLNCPYVGTTLYEFTLNTELINKDSQETVDISCVAGVSTFGSIVLINGGKWTDNISQDSVKIIKNKALYQNGGISGVYPYGCTACISHKGAFNCEGQPKFAKPNRENICNVERNAQDNGGLVRIGYIKSNEIH